MIGGKQQNYLLGNDAPGRAVRDLIADESGGTLVFSAFALTLVLGVAALGIDTTIWYTSKRQLQTVADAAAVSAAAVLAKDGGEAAARQAVLDNAAVNGFVDGNDGKVTVNVPPASGPNAGRSGFAEVILSRSVPASLGSLFLDGDVEVRARAVGGVVMAGSNCVLALDPTLDAAVELKGSPDIELNCGIASNSNSDKAILIKGDAAVWADSLQSYGQIAVETNGYLGAANPLQPLSERLPDPFATVEIPSPDPECDDTPVSYGKESVTVFPGLHCGGFKFNDTEVTFLPGVHVIDSGSLSTKGSTWLTGSDVTFVFTSADPAKIGGPSLAGGTVANLFAPGPEGHFPYYPMHPYHGDYAGMLFIQDPAAPPLLRNDLTGGSAMNFGGALYFPNQEIVYSGGASEVDGCVQIVARKISFSGNSAINYDPTTCEDQGVDHMRQTRVRIVE